MNIGVIGYGYWGPNLVRNFSLINGVKVTQVADLREERLEAARKAYPWLRTSAEALALVNARELDALVIATPVATHYELAKAALVAGKHVLVEKPLTADSLQANELIELAREKNRILMVDHTFLYTGAVKKIKQITDSGEIGKLNYFDSTRINLGLFQPDINVLWDLASHDLSILLYLLHQKPVSVNATGISHTGNGIENIAYLTVNYDTNFIAHFSCSWSSPVKIRRTLIGGDKKMVLYNDMEPSEKIKIYNTGYEYRNDEEKQKILVDYRVSDIYIPKLETKEALLSMAESFVSSAATNTMPPDNELALDIIRILEASQLSLKNKGKEILI